MGIFKICKIPLINCDQSNQHQGHFIEPLDCAHSEYNYFSIKMIETF